MDGASLGLLHGSPTYEARLVMEVRNAYSVGVTDSYTVALDHTVLVPNQARMGRG